jgi:hypothetical protein
MCSRLVGSGLRTLRIGCGNVVGVRVTSLVTQVLNVGVDDGNILLEPVDIVLCGLREEIA